MDFLVKYFPMILNAFFATVQVSTFGMVMGFVLGTLLAIGDLYGGKFISTIIKFYVEFFRGSPLIVQLFLFYYSVPPLLNIKLSNFVAGLLAFGLNSAAYQKGYVKEAIMAVYGSQMMVALSLGLSKVQALTYVILPQAYRMVIPPVSNEFCSLAKSTSVLLVIGVRELTSAAKTIASQTWRIIETYSFVMLIYLLFIYAVMKALDILYAKVKIPEMEVTA